jgi:hypothetical protein
VNPIPASENDGYQSPGASDGMRQQYLSSADGAPGLAAWPCVEYCVAPVPGTNDENLPMNVLPYFTAVSDHAVFRPIGHVNLAQVAKMIEQSIELAKTRQVRKLLAVITGLDGFPSPTLAERFLMVEKWAAASAGLIKFALVIQPWLMNPERFGILVARNRGLIANVFTLEEDARAWLFGA